MAKVKRPSVSVLVPVYNVAKYLRQCLDSLVGQTLKNIEIVCVDDGSTDDSAQILEEYAKKDGRIVVVHKPNGGLPSARNAGLDVARGEYVGFVDADDFADEEMFARMYARAKKNKADIVVCGANCIPQPAPRWIESTLSPNSICYKSASVVALLYERGARPFLWRDLVRRELIERGHYRLDESIVVGEDQAFQFKIFPAARRIAFMPDKLYNYRWRRTGSIMNQLQEKDSGTRVMEHIRLVGHIGQSWTAAGLFERNAARLFRWSIEFIYGDFIKASACDRVTAAQAFCPRLVDKGYYLCAAELPAHIRERFEYMDSFRAKRCEAPALTVAIAANGNGAALEDSLRSVLGQSLAQIEAVVYVSSDDEWSTAVARRWLKGDDRVCLRVAEPNWSFAEQYDRVIHSAKGRYIAFFRPGDRFAGLNAAERAVARLDADGGALSCGGQSDYRCSVYRTAALREGRIAFRDCSFWTGRMFLVRCRMRGRAINEEGLVRTAEAPYPRDLSAAEAENLLRAAVWLLRAGRAFGMRELVGRVSAELRNPELSRLVTDATFPCEEGDVGREAFRLLVQANALAAADSEEEQALLPPLARFVRLRQDLAAAAPRR